MDTSGAPEGMKGRAELLSWYSKNAAILPFRAQSEETLPAEIDPYPVWLSEIMLQQTRVETVIPYFERFISRWPSVVSLAHATIDEVRAEWSGLGYYRRAELLHKAANIILKQYGGQFPKDPLLLKELPGFGPYTTAAVASIAFKLPMPAIDGNVERILARVHLIEFDPKSPQGIKEVSAYAQKWMSRCDVPGDLNQAWMDLGRNICTPKNPKCLICPLHKYCSARLDQKTSELPIRPIRKNKQELDLCFIVLVRSLEFGFETLLHRVSESFGKNTQIFKGLWCPYIIQGHIKPETLQKKMSSIFKKRNILQWDKTSYAFIHVLTHRKINVHVYRADIDKNSELQFQSEIQSEAFEWIPSYHLQEYGIPSITRKSIEICLNEEERKTIRIRSRQAV